MKDPPNPHGPVIVHVCRYCGGKSPTYVGRMPKDWIRTDKGEVCRRCVWEGRASQEARP